MDDELRRLEQRVLSAPGDEAARARLRGALARLANLGDLERWRSADPAAQDAVLAVVARLLAPAFEWLGTCRAGGEAPRVASFLHGRTRAALLLVPGGTLRMGSRKELEAPVHEVAVPPLLIGRLPLLQREWDLLGGEDARTWRGEDLPIEGVSWEAARDWLLRAGGGLRLPSEAEWEWACRAGSGAAFPWGEEMDARRCWFGEGQGWRTHPPAEHADQPNAFGLVDAVGNVGEWCEDDFVAGYRGAPADGSPRLVARRGGRRGRLRVVRGGDAFNPASHCRSAYRSAAPPEARGAGIGLRLARSWPL